MRLSAAVCYGLLFAIVSSVTADTTTDHVVLIPFFIGSSCARPPFPVDPADLPGAFGTHWSSELWLLNTGPQPQPFYVCVPLSLCDVLLLNPGQLLPIGRDGFCAPLLAGQGPLIMPDVFYYQLWAIERSSGQRVALPIVHAADLHQRAFRLMGIPVQTDLRHTLRFYEFDAHPSTRVTVRLLSSVGVVLSETSVELTAPTRSPNQYAVPGYAQFGSLAELFRDVSAWPPIVHIEIVPDDSTRRIWAMATITNNISKGVTVLTPDQER